MAMQRVNLVFCGLKTRVVPVRIEGGMFTSGIIDRELKPGESLLGVIEKFKGNLMPAKADRILRAQIALAIEHPETIEVPGMKIRVMRYELTDRQFGQVVPAGEITGQDADKLIKRINQPTGAALTYLSDKDQARYIEDMERKTGVKYRPLTEEELDNLPIEVKNQLIGENYFRVMTKTGNLVLRHLLLGNRGISYPGSRDYNVVARLVVGR